ncbi:MAG: hypothetical protein ACYCOO_01380 [Chitinophagaceae bacterium]
MKNKLNWPKWLVILSYGVGILFLLIIGSLFLNPMIENKVQTRLKNFSPYLKINFTSLHTRLFTSSLSIKGLDIQYQPDPKLPRHYHEFYFSKIAFNGINLIKILFTKTLSIDHLRIGKGKIDLDPFLLDKKDPVLKRIMDQVPFKNFEVNHFQLAPTSVWLRTGKRDHLLLFASTTIDGIKMKSLKNPLSKNNLKFSTIKATLSDINYLLTDVGDTLEVKKITLNSKKQKLDLDQLKFIPSCHKAEMMKMKYPTDYLEASVSSISMTRLNMMKLLDREFIAGKMIIHDGEVDMIRYRKNSPKRKDSSFQLLKGQLPLSIQIDSFIIDHSNIVDENYGKNNPATAPKQSLSIPFKNLSIHHLDINDAAIAILSNNQPQISFKASIDIDKLTAVNSTPIFQDSSLHFFAFNGDLSSIRYNLPQLYATLQIKKLQLNSQLKILNMDSLKIIPLYPKIALGRKLGHQIDYIKATVAQIKMAHLDVRNLFKRKLIADDLMINGSKIYVFRDRRLPRPRIPQLLPVDFLKTLPITIRVKKFQLNQAEVEYEEFPKGGTQTGILKVENLNASISPLLNHPQGSDPHHLDMRVRGSIMGSGTIAATISMPFNSKNYLVKGVIKNLDLTKINSSAENLGKFHIRSGILNNLIFRFHFNEKKATGKIVGVYHNLRIDKLKGNDKKVAWLKSLLLQNLIIRKNKGKTMPVANRTGMINYRRDPTRLISYYLLKSLLSGIEASFKLGFLLPK